LGQYFFNFLVDKPNRKIKGNNKKKLPQWIHHFQLKIFNKTLLWVYDNVSISNSLVVFVCNMSIKIVG